MATVTSDTHPQTGRSDTRTQQLTQASILNFPQLADPNLTPTVWKSLSIREKCKLTICIDFDRDIDAASHVLHRVQRGTLFGPSTFLVTDTILAKFKMGLQAAMILDTYYTYVREYDVITTQHIYDRNKRLSIAMKLEQQLQAKLIIMCGEMEKFRIKVANYPNSDALMASIYDQMQVEFGICNCNANALPQLAMEDVSVASLSMIRAQSPKLGSDIEDNDMALQGSNTLELTMLYAMDPFTENVQSKNKDEQKQDNIKNDINAQTRKAPTAPKVNKTKSRRFGINANTRETQTSKITRDQKQEIKNKRSKTKQKMKLK